MADIKTYKPYFYIEGYRTRIMRAMVTTGIGMPARANIIIPGSKWGGKIVPGTRVELWLEENEEDGPFLYFSGSVKERPSRNVGLGNKTLTLDCWSDFASLMEARIQTIGIRDSIGVAGQGQWQLLVGRGTIRVPGGVGGTAAAASLWKELLKTDVKGSVKGTKESNTDQVDKVAQFKGKLLSVIQALMMMHPMHFDHLRRTQFLDRLGAYIDENAVRILRTDAGGKVLQGKFKGWIVDAAFQGNKTAWQAINDLVGAMFHDTVSVCPPIKDSHEILNRGPMYLPPVKWVDWMMGSTDSVKPTDIKLEDFTAVERTSSSVLEMLIKPDMRGCFPPQCNVIKPDMYEQFTMSHSTQVTRMGMYIPVLSGKGMSVLRPDVLESVYYRSLKYGGKRTKFAPKSDLLNSFGNDFVTNEERMLNKIGYMQDTMNPAVAKTYSGAIRADWENGKKELERKLGELSKEEIRSLFARMPYLGDVDDKTAIEEIKVIMKARGLSAVEATTMAKKYVKQYGSMLQQSITAYNTLVNQLKEDEANVKDVTNSTPRDQRLALIKKWQDQYRKTVSSLKTPDEKKRLDAMLNDPPGVDDYLIAYRQEAQKRYDEYRSEQMSVEGALNLSAVCGFPALFVDPDGDDVIGYLHTKVDVLDWSSGAATTKYVVQGARDLYSVDFNSPTRQKKFMLNHVGQNHFSWGKTFDYSSMVYQKFLRSKAFVPAMMSSCGFESTKAKNFLRYMVEGLSTTINPDDRTKLVYIDDGLAHLGLCVRDGDMSRMYPEYRNAATVDGKIGSVFLDDREFDANTTKLVPNISTIRDIYKDRSREQFYCVADVMANMVEADKSLIKEKLALLDARNGRLGYIFDNFNVEKDVPPIAVEYFKQFDGDATKPLIRDDRADMAKKTKYVFKTWPRRDGNPGVSFTDLLLSYLSTFEKPLTANDVHGDGKPPRNLDLEKMKDVTDWHKGRYKEAARSLIKKIVNNIASDMEKDRKLYFNSDGTPVSAMDSMLDKDINATYQKLEAEKKTAEMEKYGKDYNRNKTNVDLKKSEKAFIKQQIINRLYGMQYGGKFYAARVAFQAEYQSTQTAANGMSVTGASGKKQSLADMSTPEIPRPMSEAECIDFRRNIVYNMIEEMKNYVRIG
jgi:hypothetical protein